MTRRTIGLIITYALAILIVPLAADAPCLLTPLPYPSTLAPVRSSYHDHTRERASAWKPTWSAK